MHEDVCPFGGDIKLGLGAHSSIEFNVVEQKVFVLDDVSIIHFVVEDESLVDFADSTAPVSIGEVLLATSDTGSITTAAALLLFVGHFLRGFNSD